jgi:CheY-like chemotaxis protein
MKTPGCGPGVCDPNARRPYIGCGHHVTVVCTTCEAYRCPALPSRQGPIVDTVSGAGTDRRDAALAAAAAHLTETVAAHLPVAHLPRFKTLLKHLFAAQGLSSEEADELSTIVAPHLREGSWWQVELPDGGMLRHGLSGHIYRVDLELDAEAGLFDRVFSGAVKPEPTPHPRKVRFVFGGEPAAGMWYLDGDPVTDPRAARLLAESEVSDVMVAGDFVTVGLQPGETWQTHLDRIMQLVSELFSPGTTAHAAVTRDELLDEAARTVPDALHLLDPDRDDERQRLLRALRDGDTSERKVAVVVLSESKDPQLREQAVRTGFADRSSAVRRVAVDAARDEGMRDLLESATATSDAWVRWRALRNLSEIGAGASMVAIRALTSDPDFQVRFEVARIMAEEDTA